MPIGNASAGGLFSYDNAALAEIADHSVEILNETRRRFSGGIEHTICVTQFLSKNLVHDYDHLQSGYAGLLSSALTTFPGVAVVEIEEARAIAAELAQSGRELAERNVPLMVSGEFEVKKSTKHGQPAT